MIHSGQSSVLFSWRVMRSLIWVPFIGGDALSIKSGSDRISDYVRNGQARADDFAGSDALFDFVDSIPPTAVCYGQVLYLQFGGTARFVLAVFIAVLNSVIPLTTICAS